MNLLKAQDLELKIKSQFRDLDILFTRNEKTTQHELIIKTDSLNRVTLPALIELANGCPYVINPISRIII